MCTALCCTLWRALTHSGKALFWHSIRHPPKYDRAGSPRIKWAFLIYHHPSFTLRRTMWFPFQFIASLAAGLFNNFQQPFDISHGGLSRLTDNQFGQIGTHAEFARAAYCNPNKTAGWTCGG